MPIWFLVAYYPTLIEHGFLYSIYMFRTTYLHISTLFGSNVTTTLDNIRPVFGRYFRLPENNNSVCDKRHCTHRGNRIGHAMLCFGKAVRYISLRCTPAEWVFWQPYVYRRCKLLDVTRLSGQACIHSFIHSPIPGFARHHVTRI